MLTLYAEFDGKLLVIVKKHLAYFLCGVLSKHRLLSAEIIAAIQRVVNMWWQRLSHKKTGTKSSQNDCWKKKIQREPAWYNGEPTSASI